MHFFYPTALLVAIIICVSLIITHHLINRYLNTRDWISPLCKNCLYNLTNLTTSNCPECNAPIPQTKPYTASESKPFWIILQSILIFLTWVSLWFVLYFASGALPHSGYVSHTLYFAPKNPTSYNSVFIEYHTLFHTNIFSTETPPLPFTRKNKYSILINDNIDYVYDFQSATPILTSKELSTHLNRCFTQNNLIPPTKQELNIILQHFPDFEPTIKKSIVETPIVTQMWWNRKHLIKLDTSPIFREASITNRGYPFGLSRLSNTIFSSLCLLLFALLPIYYACFFLLISQQWGKNTPAQTPHPPQPTSNPQ